MNLRDLVHLPPDYTELLPHGWQILGTIILVKIPDALADHSNRIGDALLTMYPRCETVLWNKGVTGPFREPICETIAGRPETETIHKENGCLFKLDVTKVMFSVGNQGERMRMAKIVRDGEIVVDMFAGIGYFSIPMAKHARPRRILAIELNPISFGYLVENIRLNHVEDIIQPLLGDCARLSPEGAFDRVIMGYLDAYQYLEQGIRALKEEGGILHYHESVPARLYPERPVMRIMDLCKSLGRVCEIKQVRKVKKYAPGVLHAVVDAEIYENA